MAARRRASARSSAARAGRPVRSGSARRSSAGARMVRRAAQADQRSGMEGRARPPLRPPARFDPRRQTPTLAELAPLYHAIAHGCRAGRHKEALEEVYTDRICRRCRTVKPNSTRAQTLGAVGSNLAAISWFFDSPMKRPRQADAAGSRLVLSVASFGLRAQGRLREALSGDARRSANGGGRAGLGERRNRRVKPEPNRTSRRRYCRRRGVSGKIGRPMPIVAAIRLVL